METTKEKRGLRLCRGRWILSALSALVIGLHHALRGNKLLMDRLSTGFVRPAHRLLGRLSAPLPFSLAELLIVAGSLGLLVYIIICALRMIRRREWLKQVYIILVTLLCAGLTVYGGFCLLWGVYYYGDDFAAKSGLAGGAVSTEELELVTRYFADLADRTAQQVPRDERGVCASDRRQLLQKSSSLYRSVEKDFPSLAGPELSAKGVALSRLLSYTDFTGFFFPFTGEANVNTDSPAAYFAATVGHELAHQRGVAKEQEANFVSVLACLSSEDPDFVYSASLLAYTHLGNALYQADRSAWESVYESLSEPVLRDLEENRRYWAQFKTPVQTISTTVYEGFLYSYDQDLGLRSYGACVDLLVHYYYPLARAEIG